MASIHKRGAAWLVRWRDPDGRERTRSCPDQATARTLARDVERVVAVGRAWTPPDRAGPPARTAIGEVVRTWIEVRVAELAERTLERYADGVDLWLAWLDETGRPATVEAFSLPTLEDWRAWLLATGRHGHKRTPATVHKLIAAVQLLWAWADESGRWPDVPRARRVRPPRLAQPEPTVPDWSDVDRLVAELGLSAWWSARRAGPDVAPDWLRRLVLVARYTGGRRSELLALTWADADLERGRLRLRGETTKGGYGGRSLPLHPALVAELRTWSPIGASLVAAPAAELSARGHCDRLLRRAWTRAGVPAEIWHGHPLHCLRAAVRTHLVLSGVHGDVVDALLGHAARGTGGRHYTARASLWPRLVEAIATIPAHAVRAPA